MIIGGSCALVVGDGPVAAVDQLLAQRLTLRPAVGPVSDAAVSFVVPNRKVVPLNSKPKVPKFVEPCATPTLFDASGGL